MLAVMPWRRYTTATDDYEQYSAMGGGIPLHEAATIARLKVIALSGREATAAVFRLFGSRFRKMI
jgi:hypothetical protein